MKIVYLKYTNNNIVILMKGIAKKLYVLCCFVKLLREVHMGYFRCKSNKSFDIYDTYKNMRYFI